MLLHQLHKQSLSTLRRGRMKRGFSCFNTRLCLHVTVDLQAALSAKQQQWLHVHPLRQDLRVNPYAISARTQTILAEHDDGRELPLDILAEAEQLQDEGTVGHLAEVANTAALLGASGVVFIQSQSPPNINGALVEAIRTAPLSDLPDDFIVILADGGFAHINGSLDDMVALFMAACAGSESGGIIGKSAPL